MSKITAHREKAVNSLTVKNDRVFPGRFLLTLLTGIGFCCFAFAAGADTTSRIVVSPDYLVLNTVAGSTGALTRTVTVANGGAGVLNFSVSESTPWFAVSSSSGAVTMDGTVITLTVDPSGLTPAGSPYVGDVTIVNTDLPQDTKKIRVRLAVLAEDAYVLGFEYDAKGRVTRRITPNGAIMEYAYNNLGKLTGAYYPDGTTVQYTYDAAGNRTSMMDAHGTTTYVYDELNRLRRVQYPQINAIGYEYDRSGKLIKIVYPDQKEVGYTYDADGRLTVVTYPAGTATYEYDNASNTLLKKTLPNGVYTTYVYDKARRVTDVVNRKSDNAEIATYHYAYDANSNITREVETTVAGTITKTYAYDKINRLVRVDYSDGTFEAWTYDAMGNRLTMTTPSGITNYEYDSSNRLLRAGDTAFFYDRNGNLVKKVSAQKTEIFTYDFNNMLVSYVNGTENVWYQYDGDLNRIAKTVNGVTTKYINDINRSVVQVLAETNAGNALTRKYIYGNELISQETF